MSAQRAYSRAAESIALDSRDAYLSTSPVKSKRRKGKTLRKALRLAADSIAVSSRTVRAHSMSSIPKSLKINLSVLRGSTKQVLKVFHYFFFDILRVVDPRSVLTTNRYYLAPVIVILQSLEEKLGILVAKVQWVRREIYEQLYKTIFR